MLVSGKKQNEELSIEPATQDDLPSMVALLDRLKLSVAGLDDHWTNAVVLRATKTVVGCATLEVYGEDGLLRSVAIDPSIRGKGLGRVVSEAALGLGLKKGVCSFYLLTDSAVEFFKKIGFSSINKEQIPELLRKSTALSSCSNSAVAMRLALKTKGKTNR